MRRYHNWKRAGILVLAAAAVGSASCGAGGGLLTAFAYQNTLVTEYDEETLNKFRDNVLEYWEIPGLIEQYNTSFRNQLEQFYYNPGGSGLTKEQLLDLAEELREEAETLDREAEDDKDGLERSVYNDYKSNARSLKIRAKNLEDAANGKSASGSSAARALRILRDQQTQTASELMREYQKLNSECGVADKGLEIAELTYESAKRQMELGLYSAENVLSAEDALNAARASVSSAQKEMTDCRRSLIKMLGWSYDAVPEILKVPEPDLGKLAEFNPETDAAKAIENNMSLFDTRMADSKSIGGANAKARLIQDQENEVRSKLKLIYMDMQQKQAAYEAAKLKYEADAADKAASDRKAALNMLSRQEILSAEKAWLSAEAEFEAASLDLTAAIEEYEWAVKGLLELETKAASQ